jgi:hypothetical protein
VAPISSFVPTLDENTRRNVDIRRLRSYEF